MSGLKPGQYVVLDGRPICRHTDVTREITLPAYLWAWVDREGMNRLGARRLVKEVFKNAYAEWLVRASRKRPRDAPEE